MVNQLLSASHEIARKVEEVANLRSKNNQPKSELKYEKEFIERLKKPKEAMKFINEKMNAPRIPHDTYGIGYVEFLYGVEQGESSKQGELRNATTKPKKKKPTCCHCGKPNHTKNGCRRKIGRSNPKPKFNGYCFNYNK